MGDIRQEFTQEQCRQRIPINLTKPQLREVIEDVQAWLTDNKISFNQGIRLPQRNLLTNKQKFHIFALTVKHLWEEENG